MKKNILPDSIRASLLIVGLTGYADGGGVVSHSINYLAKHLQCREVSSIDGDSFLDYTLNRPIVTIRSGIAKTLQPSKYRILLSEDRGVLIISGPEPNLRWKRFIDILLRVAKNAKAKSIYTIGGFIDHVDEPKVSYVLPDESLKEHFQLESFSPIEYKGPSSIYTLTIKRAFKKGFQAISLWVHVPYSTHVLLPQLGWIDYWSSFALLSAIKQMANLELDLKDAEELCRKFRNRLDVIKHVAEQRTLSDTLGPPLKYIF
ncbi:MAG: proteasome assembly chaperone family protein [Candidatus Nezhaarchaeales archaeon]